MFKAVFALGAGVAGIWKVWPADLGWHPIAIVLGTMLIAWACLVATICTLDHRRKRADRRIPFKSNGNFPRVSQARQHANAARSPRPRH